MKKMWNQKGSQGLCRNVVDHINNYDNDDPASSIFVVWVIIIKIFNVTNSIPAQALVWFHSSLSPQQKK